MESKLLTRTVRFEGGYDVVGAGGSPVGGVAASAAARLGATDLGTPCRGRIPQCGGYVTPGRPLTKLVARRYILAREPNQCLRRLFSEQLINVASGAHT